MTDPDSQVTFRSGFVTADFLAHNYRISGEVNVRARPLADSLSDPTTDYISVDNIYVSPIQDPADIKASYPHGSLLKTNISMVVVAREEDGLSKSTTYGDYLGRYTLRPVFLTMPGFEVRGFMEMAAKADIKTHMVGQAQRFIPIIEGKATVTLDPAIRFEGGMILANRQSVGIICLVEEEES